MLKLSTVKQFILKKMPILSKAQLQYNTHLVNLNKLKGELEHRYKFLVSKYEDFYGITKLSELQKNVLLSESKVHNIREKRRKIQDDIFLVQTRLKDAQDMLHKTPMGDDKYIAVVTQVHELLKEQKYLENMFSLCDKTEREDEATLALDIKNSHDHERTYREKTKYISLIAGIIGGLIGVLGARFNNWSHRKDLKNFASDIYNHVDDLKLSVEKLSYVSSSEQSKDVLSAIKALDNALQNLQMFTKHGTLKNESFSSDLYIEKIDHLEKKIDAQSKYNSNYNARMIGSVIILGAVLLFMIDKH